MMADETGCLRRFKSLLAVQIEKAKSLRGVKEESELSSEDTGGSHLEYRDNPTAPPPDVLHTKTIMENKTMFRSSSEDIEQPVAVTQFPRKRKANMSHLLSDDCGFNSPQKIFIVVADGQEEADTNVTSAMSEHKTDVSNFPHTAHGATEITNAREQSIADHADDTDEIGHVHRKDDTVTVQFLQNEFGIHSAKATKVNDLGTDGDEMPTVSDKQSKIRQTDGKGGFREGTLVQTFETRIQKYRLHSHVKYNSHQSETTSPHGVCHQENLTGRTEVCPSEIVKKANGADYIRSKCKVNVPISTPNTSSGNTKIADVRQESKSKPVDCEWEYDCDHIQHLLLPVKKEHDQGQLTLFQELQQAEQQQHQLKKCEDRSTPRLALLGGCLSLQCSQKRDPSQHTVMTRGVENQSLRTGQFQEENMTTKESQDSGPVIENSGSKFYRLASTNEILNKPTSPNDGCQSANVSLLLPQSCPEEEKLLNDMFYLGDNNLCSVEDDMTTVSCCKEDAEIELNDVFFDAVSFTTDTVGAGIKQGIFSSNVFVSCERNAAMLSDSELDMSDYDYEDCHSELDKLDSGDCLETAQKPNFSALSDVTLTEEKHLTYSEDSSHKVFLATMPVRIMTDNGKDCRTFQQGWSETGHNLCVYSLVGLASLVDGVFSQSAPSGIPVSVDTKTDTEFLTPELFSTTMLPPTDWPHIHQSSQPDYDGVQELCGIGTMNSSKSDVIPGTDCLESGEQFSHCFLTLNNNSLPSESKRNSNINSQTQSSICVSGNRDYLLEYNYTHRGKKSSTSVSPFQRRNTHVTQKFRETMFGVNSRCRQNIGRLPFRRHPLPKVKSDTISNFNSSGCHPKDCKCLENDCLRRRGELLHDHVMKNLHVLKKFATNGSNQRSNFSLRIKEAVGDKARELIQKQRSVVCREPECTPSVKKSSRLFCTQAERQKSVHRDELKFSSNGHSLNLLSKDSPLRPKALREHREEVDNQSNYHRATAASSAYGISRTKPLKHRWTLKKGLNENRRTIANFSQSAATDSDKVPSQDKEKFENKSQSPKDTLHEGRSFVKDLIALEIEQKGSGSTHLKDALKRLQALNQVDEECDKLIQRLEEFKRQRLVISRRDTENNTQTPTTMNLQSSDKKHPIAVGDTGLCTIQSSLDHPSSTYFLSVEVPKPRIYKNSLHGLAPLPTKKPGDVSHETKNTVTRLGQKTVTREVEEHQYNPVTGKTISYFYSLSEDGGEKPSNRTPSRRDSDATTRDIMLSDDALPPYSAQNQTSKPKMATVGVQTSSDEAANGLHIPRIIKIDSDDELDTDADVAQSVCSKDGLFSETLASTATQKSKNPLPLYHYSESKTSIEMCSPSGSMHSVKIIADEEIIDTVTSANQIPRPATAEGQEKTSDKSIWQKENVDGSDIQAEPLPIVIVSDICGDISPYTSCTMGKMDKTTQTEISQSETKTPAAHGTTTIISRSSSPAPSIDSKTSEGFANISPCSQTSSCFAKSGKHSPNSPPESAGTRLYESSSCQGSNNSPFTSSGKKFTSSPSDIPVLEKVCRHSQKSSMSKSPIGSYYSSQFDPKTKKDSMGNISSSTESRSGCSKSSSLGAYKTSTKTSSRHSPSLGSKTSSSSRSSSPKGKRQERASSPAKHSPSSASSGKSKPSASMVVYSPTPSINAASTLNDNHKESAMHSSIEETSSTAPMSSISKVSDGSVRSVTFSKSNDNVRAVPTPSGPCSESTSSLMNTIRSVLKQLKSYVSLAVDTFRDVGASRTIESETLIPSSSESHLLATGVKSRSFVGKEQLRSKNSYHTQTEYQPVTSTQSQTDSNHIVSRTITSAEGSYRTTQNGKTQTTHSSSSGSYQESISVLSEGPCSIARAFKDKNTVTSSEERQSSSESVANQSIRIEPSHRSFEERSQTSASKTPSPVARNRSCPSGEADRPNSICNQSDTVPQRMCTGRHAVLRVALILQHLCHAVQPYGPAMKRTVITAALVAMVTGGYLCGQHCCLDTLALRSSVSLERLLEDVMMHLSLRNVAVPPF